MAGPCFQQDFFTLQRKGRRGEGGRERGREEEKNEWKRQKSSSPGRLLNRLNIPRSHFLPVCFFDNKKGEEGGNLKNSQRFRLTILIADSSGKINSLMSAVVSPIKVLGRRLVRALGYGGGDCNLWKTLMWLGEEGLTLATLHTDVHNLVDVQSKSNRSFMTDIFQFSKIFIIWVSSWEFSNQIRVRLQHVSTLQQWSHSWTSSVVSSVTLTWLLAPSQL